MLRVLDIMLIALLLKSDKFGYHFRIHFSRPQKPGMASILASKMEPGMASVVGPLLIGLLLKRHPFLEVLGVRFISHFRIYFGCLIFHFFHLLKVLNIMLIAFLLKIMHLGTILQPILIGWTRKAGLYF